MRSIWIQTGIAFLAWVSAVYAETTRPDEVVAYFGDTPVYAEEMALHIRDHVALVAVHFKTRHNQDLAGKNWLTEVDGETPVALLQQRALASCQKAKAIQLLAQENNIGKPLSFPGFSEACQQMNQKRAKDKAEGKILYGPLEYTPSQLYEYKLGNMRIHLKDVLSSGTFEQKDQALENAIQKRIDSWSIRLEAPKLQTLIAEQVGAI